MTPDSGKTVLRSRLGRNYRQLPASETVTREPPGYRNRLLTGYSTAESDLAAETLFLSRRLSFRRLLLLDSVSSRSFPNYRNLLMGSRIYHRSRGYQVGLRFHWISCRGFIARLRLRLPRRSPHRLCLRYTRWIREVSWWHSMCGILGYFHKGAGADHQLGATVLSMLQALGRRGPDSAGVALVGPAHRASYIVRVQAGDELEMSQLAIEANREQSRTSPGRSTARTISPAVGSMCVFCLREKSTCPR